MNDEEQAHADLAFMRALVQEGGRSQMAGGLVFLAAGLLYALQCFVYWMQFSGFTHFSSTSIVAFTVAVTVAFLVVLVLVIWSERSTGERGVGTRALNGAFGGTGLANLALCCVFGLIAHRRHDMVLWQLYPVTLCIVQGLAWYVAFIVRRRGWLALVSVGWYATAIGLALLIDTVAFVLLLALALLLLMALPGAVMMRLARKSV